MQGFTARFFTIAVVWCFTLDLVEGATRCCSNRRGSCYSCSSRNYCCNSQSYPCCESTSLTTGAIVGIVISLIFVVVIIAIVVFLFYRASQRKKTGVVLTTGPQVQTVQTVTYQHGAYPPGQPGVFPGQVYPPGQANLPGQSYPPPIAYGTNPVYPPAPAKY